MTSTPPAPGGSSGRRRPLGTSLLSLAFDGARLEALELHRPNGSVEIRHRLETDLALDLLTTEPELVGREIRKLLDTAGIKERRCVVALPQSWALSFITALPELSEADRADFLALEAERGFASGAESLVVSHTLSGPPNAPRFANVVGISRQHVARLEAVLTAAHLRPSSFSLGSVAHRPATSVPEEGTIYLLAADRRVHLMLQAWGGVLGVRTIEDAFEAAGSDSGLQTDLVCRELRITRGQLPPEVGDTLHRLCVLGAGERATELAEALGPRLAAVGLEVRHRPHYEAGDLPLKVPVATPISAALSLGVRALAGEPAALEFLPPKISRWEEFSRKYASRKLVPAGALAGLVAVLTLGAFGIQQARLAYWQSRWNKIKTPVTELETTQKNIRAFRAWYDDSYRSLSVLRRLSEAFPEDGTVSAKTLEIRQASGITCTGTARDNQALLKTVDRLRSSKEIQAVKIDQIRGRTPMQFTLNFQWSDRGTP